MIEKKYEMLNIDIELLINKRRSSEVYWQIYIVDIERSKIVKLCIYVRVSYIKHTINLSHILNLDIMI